MSTFRRELWAMQHDDDYRVSRRALARMKRVARKRERHSLKSTVERIAQRVKALPEWRQGWFQ